MLESLEVIKSKKIINLFMLRNLSINMKFKFVLMWSLFFSVLLVLTIGFFIYKNSLTESTFKQLNVIKTVEKNNIENFISNTSSQVSLFAENDMIIEAVKKFTNAFDLIKNEIIYPDSTGSETKKHNKSLSNYYATIYLPVLNKRFITKESSLNIFPEEQSVQYLQDCYISSNMQQENKRYLLVSNTENTTYNRTHEKYHPYLLKILQKEKLGDLYLLDNNGNIIYSTTKGVDFATNVMSGPYKQTGLAKAYSDAIQSKDDNFVKFIDLSFYSPSNTCVAGFFSAPVYDKDEKIGVLVFEITTKALANLLSLNSDEYNSLLGKSGEVYIVGEDLLMRTDSRLLRTDTAKYINLLINQGCDKNTINDIIRLKSNILLQEIKTHASFSAIKGRDGQLNNKDYLDRNVYSVFSPIKMINGEWAIIVQKDKQEVLLSFHKLEFVILFSVLIIFLIVLFFGHRFSKAVSNRINFLKESLQKLTKGEEIDKFDSKSNDEIGQTTNALNHLSQRIKEASDFASKVGKGDFSSDFKAQSTQDKLGISLTQMKESLLKAEEDQKLIAADEEKRNWAASGIAKFSEILRIKNVNIEDLSSTIISNLIEYINANQGGIYIVEENKDQKNTLVLKASYAYNKQKFIKRTFEVGEGLVGTCAIEKKKIFLKEIPKDYLEIVSGLGNTEPASLLLLPLKLENEILGVLEIASLNVLGNHEIEFLQEISRIVASTLSTFKMNIKTAKLLEESKKRTQDIEQQEEELRQNMEELQATQEEISRLSEDSLSFVNGIDKMFMRADLNLAGVFTYANARFLQETGYELSDLKQMHLKDLIHKSYHNDFISQWDKLTKGTFQYEKKLIITTKEANERNFKVNMVALKNKKKAILKILLVGIDV